MVVSKTAYVRWVTLVGTIAEVIQSLSDDNVPASKVRIFYNGTNMTAVYSL